MVLCLNNDDVTSLLDMPTCVKVLEEGFREFGMGMAVATNRRDSFSPTKQPNVFYRLNTMEGIVHKLGVSAQRIDSERITWENVGGQTRQIELPSKDNYFVGLIYLYSIEDCRLLAIMNDSQIQRMRVAGICGVAAKYLSRKNSSVLGLFGSGWQAEAQVTAMSAVRDLSLVKVYSPTPSHRRDFATRMTKATGIDVRAVDDPLDVTRGADIVSVATNAREPVCKSHMVSAGQHLTSIGGADFDEESWNMCDLIYLCAKGLHEKYLMADPQMRPDLSKDHMFSSGGVDKNLYSRFASRTRYIPDLLVGNSPIRTSEQQITLFQKTGTSQGIEFASTAKAVYDLAVKKGFGKETPDEWFVQRTPQ